MAAFPLVLGLVGVATSIWGQVKSGQAQQAAGTAQKEASDSQAGLADYNAAVADIQAQDALDRGATEESRFRTQVRGMIGAQRAATAAGNIDVSFGSAVDVQADSAYLGELDALQIHNNAAREAWGFKVTGEDLRKRAEIARKTGVYQEKAGGQAQSAAYWGAGGTLLTGAGSLLQQKYGIKG
jgi:hypothetical protein